MQVHPFAVQGETLHGEHHAPPPGTPVKGALVAVHGLNSNLTEMGTFPERLAAAGYHVLAFDMRGFGRSGGEMARTDRERALADIAAAASQLEDLAPRLPLGIIGHSLGGAYAVAALATLDRFAYGVLCHPVDRLWDEIGLVQRAAYHVLGRNAQRRMAKGKAPGFVPYTVKYDEIFVSKEHALAARPEFLLKRANLGNYAFAHRSRASDVAADVRVPTLTVWSRLDAAVRPEHTRALVTAFGLPTEFFEHQGGHSCFRDRDGDKVAAGVIAWLDRVAAPMAASSQPVPSSGTAGASRASRASAATALPPRSPGAAPQRKGP